MIDVFNSGKTFKRLFGAELRINGDDEEKSAKRPPIYAFSSRPTSDLRPFDYRRLSGRLKALKGDYINAI